MTDLLSSIPSSVIAMLTGVIVAMISVYFSRKQTSANVADKITLAAGRSLDQTAKRMDVLEEELARTERIHEEETAQAKRLNSKLAARVSSLEHNEIENQKWIKSLEGMHEELQADHRKLSSDHKGLRHEHKELMQRYDDLLERYRRLKEQVDGSSPHLRAGKGK